MNNPYLLLWLEAPLQSWGHDSKFGRRDSLDFPTKSGVFGLLCCALGAGGKQTEWLKEWADCDMQVQAFVLSDRRGQPMVRQPLLRDFQMVGSGYDDKDPWQNLLIPKTSEGKKAVGGGTKMTYRYYLQDMAFAVALQGPTAKLKELESALQNPVWDLYLGRKNCVPTEFIAQGIHADSAQAMEQATQLAEMKGRLPSFKVLQGEHEGNVFTLNDVPLQFGQQKLYRDRRVTVLPVD
ncbi:MULTISPECIES: type I-E CRISPR-associated protein Cas5/CasD [Idiomarina]|uniref:type I-E CRISPR-associated protein Cas5/CasD n=1 Tax=Idiomarina TaxID=135575 RepID=UPI00129C402B|nr:MULTISPECIES: type I-E CRISPR-associated protein Cas5/CasD [Idiomarina]MRJ43146.1 type I-E CRISPR-associated protein Cas5/CasD [Idiomarina sp. FeN1]NCU57158.1 type I-E CRISPR-associated protein Cas5/CasD [Idiomarina sp. FenA--70]NCU59867.1 type I-E CRISPR-associated protein Cas5/CasD [Idiomarina sp. FenBw--71]UUN13146.1 type I-E CRISPR-associated protein Cas5/CasD [Idiomarina loihiensis]